MQSHFSEPEYSTTEESPAATVEPTHFHSRFVDSMELYADANTVATYLDSHHGWFCRCAQPMTVEPLGKDSYALTVGRFGSFGYDVEPKIGLDLLPQDQGVYRIQTVPIPGYEAPGYDVDFQAAMELVETPAAEPRTVSITRVQWQLDLTVTIQFPRFIRALPKSLVQSTGDRLLRQVVRQVSQRLTRKVQEDFHATCGVQPR